MTDFYLLAAVFVMSAVTILLRLLPFALFGKRQTPAFVDHLGKVLPYAVMGMLVVYCLKAVDLTQAPFALGEIVSVAVVVLLQVWRRNTLLSIIGGTVCYMLIIRLIG